MKNDEMQRRAAGVKLSSTIFCVTVLVAWLPARGQVQVISGSDGHEGVFNPTTNTNMDMASHPDGIYQYQSVNIRSGVTVTFTNNANNTPVVWLVQSNCVISGAVDVSGHDSVNDLGAQGGPGGFRGGDGGPLSGSAGQGPGGGMLGGYAFSASYGTLATLNGVYMTNGAGQIYGNSYLLPLLGGSGGGDDKLGNRSRRRWWCNSDRGVPRDQLERFHPCEGWE